MSKDVFTPISISSSSPFQSSSSDFCPSREQTPDQLFLSGHIDPLISPRVLASPFCPFQIPTMSRSQRVPVAPPSSPRPSSKPRPAPLESSDLKLSELTNIKE